MAEDVLNIKIKAEDLYNSTLDKMNKDFAKAAVAVSGSLAAISAAMISITNEASRVGVELLKWSQITGVNVRELSKLRTITAEAGGNIEQMFDVLKELNVKMKEAQDGTGAFSENIKHLGVQFEDSEGQLRDTTQVFIEVTAALNSLENAALRTAIADELFSDAGTELLPVLLEQKDAIADLTKETGKYSDAVTEEQAKAAKEFSDNMSAMTTAAETLRVKIGNQLIPIANEFFDIMRVGSADIKEVAPTTFSELSFQIAILSQELERNENKLKNVQDLTIAETFSLKPLIENQKVRIKQLKEERDAITERDEAAVKTVGGARTPGGAGDQALRERLIAEQVQAKKDVDNQILQMEIQLRADLQSIENQNIAANEELTQQAIDREIEQYMSAFDLEYEATIAQNERLGQLALSRHEYQEELRKQDLKNEKQTAAWKMQTVQNSAIAIVNTLEALNTISQGQHESQFQALKIARTAQAIVDTYAGANKALADPSLPTYVGWAAAAAIITAGLANVAVIQSTTFGGGGGAGASGGAIPAVTQDVPTQSVSDDEVRPQAVTIMINNPMGDEDYTQLVEDKVLPAMRNLSRNNVQTSFP